MVTLYWFKSHFIWPQGIASACMLSERRDNLRRLVALIGKLASVQTWTSASLTAQHKSRQKWGDFLAFSLSCQTVPWPCLQAMHDRKYAATTARSSSQKNPTHSNSLFESNHIDSVVGEVDEKINWAGHLATKPNGHLSNLDNNMGRAFRWRRPASPDIHAAESFVPVPCPSHWLNELNEGRNQRKQHQCMTMPCAFELYAASLAES